VYHVSQTVDTTKNILYSQIILANKSRYLRTFLSPTPSDFIQQQEQYSHKDKKASSGETVGIQHSLV
jgi:hypothetical protein